MSDRLSKSQMFCPLSCFLFVLFVLFVVPFSARAQVFNLKVVTDANPDYTDLPSLVYSATSRWETPEEKCRAMFYWNHIARRQTNPIVLHGMALPDPIRQFNDYGYTMCSTISGINCSIWDAMRLKASDPLHAVRFASHLAGVTAGATIVIQDRSMEFGHTSPISLKRSSTTQFRRRA